MKERYHKYYSDMYKTTRQVLSESKKHRANVHMQNFNPPQSGNHQYAQGMGFMPLEDNNDEVLTVKKKRDPHFFGKDPSGFFTEEKFTSAPGSKYNKDDVTDAEEIQEEVIQHQNENKEVRKSTPVISDSKDEKVDEQQFMDDLKAILQKKKKTGPEDKKSTSTPSGKSQQGSGESSSGNKETNNISTQKSTESEKKDHHDIFDKLARSMKYANAYDLGPIELEQRFDDFDKMDELNQKDKSKNHSTAAPKKQVMEEEQEMEATQEDFIRDLDEISKSSKAKKEESSDNEISDQKYMRSKEGQEGQPMAGNGEDSKTDKKAKANEIITE